MWSNGHTNGEGRRKSDIACYACRRRKVRCDRRWPQCSVCVDTSQDCNYPEGPLKPGPKLGSLKRSRKRSLQQLQDDATPPKPNSLRKRPDYKIQDAEPTLNGRHSPRNNSAFNDSAPRADDDSTTAEKDSSNTRDRPDSRSNIQDLSFILHPAHEASSPDKEQSSELTKINQQQPTEIQKAFVALGMTGGCVSAMVKVYFDNMVAINLFREPQFAKKLHGAVKSTHISALLAAISAYAARFCPEKVEKEWIRGPGDLDPGKSCDGQSPAEYLLTLAFGDIDAALRECGDEPPSLCILQALIIATHLQLTQGVRGKAWRSLGTCIRLAYELDLHLVDSSCEDFDDLGVEQWCWREEKRRAWWAIWEMDVFASTIRRTPPAIDWSQIETLLPVEDEHWFGGRPRPSCFMERDPIHRWKTLHECGNQSPKAWFLVVNSLMKEAQTISSPRSIPNRSPCRQRHPRQNGSQVGPESTTSLSDDANQKLETLANSVQCFTLVLPENLRYRNQYLNFEARTPGQVSSTRQDHCSIYNIYVMVQLAKLMIHRYDVFRSLSPGTKPEQEPANPGLQNPNPTGSHSISDTNNVALAQYFEAADNILTIVKRSSEGHIRYINPFLSSTIWLASAVQIFRQEFEHGETRRTFIKSKFEVLYMTYKQCVTWWNIHTALQQNLEALETQLESFRKFNDSAKGRQPRTPTNPSAGQSKRARSRSETLLLTGSGRNKTTTEGEIHNIQGNTVKLTVIVNSEGPSSFDKSGGGSSNENNASQVASSALENPPLSVSNAGFGGGGQQHQASLPDNSYHALPTTQTSPSRMNDLPILDCMHLQFFEGSNPGEQSYSQMDLNPSAELLDPMLSARSDPECSSYQFLANDQVFGQGVSSDLPNNIHDLLSGYSMY